MTETRTEWRVAYEEWSNDGGKYQTRHTQAEAIKEGVEGGANFLATFPERRNVRVQQRTVTEWVDA